MDNFFMHLAPLPRRFPATLAIQSVGYTPQKTEQVRRTFDSLNFSLILSGTGHYYFRGERIAVAGPCVITQWPGEPMNYGPDEGGAWEEFFMIYDAGALEEFSRRNLARIHKPCWPIRRETQVREQFAHLLALLRDTTEDGMADRIDRACELLVVETRLGEHRPAAGREEMITRQIRQHVREHPYETHDFGMLASRHGLSAATFRRYWARYVHETPARYVMSLRIREARRLLVETELTVAEIAEQTGFEDPLYFSRCFRRMAGVPPTAYRARFPH